MQVVHGLRLGPILGRHAPSLLELLPVVEELSSEELVHLAL